MAIRWEVDGWSHLGLDNIIQLTTHGFIILTLVGSMSFNQNLENLGCGKIRLVGFGQILAFILTSFCTRFKAGLMQELV